MAFSLAVEALSRAQTIVKGKPLAMPPPSLNRSLHVIARSAATKQSQSMAW